MKKALTIILIISLSILCQCGDEDRADKVSDESPYQKETTPIKLNNIAGVKLINLTEKDNRINRGLFSLDETGKGYFIDTDWGVYPFSMDDRSIGEQLTSISVMDGILQDDEKVLSFIYYADKGLVDVKTKEQDTEKVNSYLIDAGSNTQISFPILDDKLKSEFVGTYNGGDKALILTHPKGETYSALYSADVLTRELLPIMEGITLLGYTLSDDRRYLIFYGNTKHRLPRETYDYTSLGNFFLYYPDEQERNPATFVYMLDLKTNHVRIVPDSFAYYYSWLKEDELFVEDYEGEFVKVDPKTGEKLDDMEHAVYRIMDYYREGHRNKETGQYTLIEVTFAHPKKERLVYIDKKSGDEVAILDVNRHIVHLYAVNDEYALFSVSGERMMTDGNGIGSGDEIVYMIRF